MLPGWITLRSAITRADIDIRADTVCAVSETFRSGAKPEDKPQYTEVWLIGMPNQPMCVEQTRTEVLEAMRKVTVFPTKI